MPSIDNPKLFLNHLASIQMVGRPFEDEELIQVAVVLDKLFHSL